MLEIRLKSRTRRNAGSEPCLVIWIRVVDERRSLTNCVPVHQDWIDLRQAGQVLVTPLALEVQEDVTSQRVRVNVVDAVSRDGLSDVHVKVIGMGSSRFVSGETDLRGVYVADAVPGYPTAIARDADGHFAFHRSESVMLAMAAPQGQQMEAGPRQVRKSTKGKADYRSNLLLDNQRIQDLNTTMLGTMFMLSCCEARARPMK